MKYIEGRDRKQYSMLPELIEDYVSENSPVRVIDAFVDALDMGELGFIRSVANHTGRPPYDPRVLLKIFIYGYTNGIRASRKLMLECGRNVELFFLTGKLTPDFRTLSDFRKDNAKALARVFLSFSKLCLKAGLYGKELLAVDGTKIRASNSKDNCYTPEVLKKKLAHIEEKIDGYMHDIDSADEDDNGDTERADSVKAALEELAARKEKYTGYLEELNASGDTQLLTTDPEARRMHSKDGFHCCYNVQSAVDEKHHLIAAYSVTNCCNDMGQLKDIADNARAILGADSISATADKGYDSRPDIQRCVMNGIIPHVIPKYDKNEAVFQIGYEGSEITEEMRLSSNPQDISACLHAGVLPKIYENTNISVTLQYPERLSCFVRNPDDTVTCPTGKILTRLRTRGKNVYYASKAACRQCKTRCKATGTHKVVSFGPDTTYVPVRMYGVASNNLTPIPKDGVMSPFNHTLDRRDYIKPTTVLITVRHDKTVTDKRKCLVEHPFGTIKRSLGAYYTLLRGKIKVSADVGLSFLAYNMKRAINVLGTKEILALMGR